MKVFSKDEFEKINVFKTGEENTVFAKYFIGNSFLNPLTKPEDGLFLANVTFEPGCRNNWHIHHASNGGGQMLLCVAGEGWYREEGKPAAVARSRFGCCDSGEREALARRKKGQLVFTHCV